MWLERKQWFRYFLHTSLCMYVLLTPILVYYAGDFFNENHTEFSRLVVAKRFLKISSVVVIISSLINLPLVFINGFVYRSAVVVIGLIFYFPSCLDLLHFFIFKSRINVSSCYAIYSTTWNEALEFVSDYSSFFFAFKFIFWISIPVLCYYILQHWKSSFFKRLGIVLFILSFLFSLFTGLFKAPLSYYKELSTHKFYASLKEYMVEIKHLVDYAPSLEELKVTRTIEPQKETYVFIIGESISPFHMQLYGYPRNTTPNLSKISSELYLLNNVHSEHVHTVESIKDLLLIHDSLDVFSGHTLIDCFKANGFHSYWLSNQGYLEKNSTQISVIAKRADHRLYINSHRSNKKDEELLPELDRILANKQDKKVVFIHLMGAHISYQKRYPNAFNVFKEENISVFGERADSYINQYDNAILYHDFVVSEIIHRVKKQEEIASVVYFSDHGEEVYDFRSFHGHLSSLKSEFMTRIPFFIWGSPTFIELKSEALKNVEKNINVTFSSRGFVHSMQDLFDVSSPYFNSSLSYFDSTSTSKLVRKSTSDLETKFPNYPNKIWIHRVNSLERLKLVQNLFDGMELDIVFKNGVFDVGHSSTPSIGLSLDTFLANVKNPTKHHFWLDLKNLSTTNANQIIGQLNYLDNKYHIKQNLIIESPSIESLPLLKNANYITSYYIPDIASLKDSSRSFHINKTAENMSIYDPNAISHNINNYYFMSKHFKEKPKLLWALHLNWNDSSNHKRIEKILEKDSTIKVCLVNYKTEGWR